MIGISELRTVSRFTRGQNTVLISLNRCQKHPNVIFSFLADKGYSPEFVISPDRASGYYIQLLAYQGVSGKASDECKQLLIDFGVPFKAISAICMSSAA